MVLEKAKKIVGDGRFLYIYLPPALLYPFASYLCVSPIGGGELFFIAPLISLPLMVLSLISIPVSLISYARDKTSIQCKRILVVSVLFFLISFGGLYLGKSIRHHGFEALVERSKPLIAAIKNYESENKEFPANLDALVPKYLSKVPQTGMSGYPTYKYEILKRPDKRNSWRLSVFCGQGISNWDEFYYLPNQDYPTDGVGGWIERIGDWAYFHE